MSKDIIPIKSKKKQSVESVNYDAQARRYTVIVRDGRGDEFAVYLNYGDGQAGIDTSFLQGD
ncbi:MAG: hypothetical protein FWE59_01755 [Oscillospiraceae bacterium]|nr:hypothetical protein [Oscillospiraceae bacterium]